MIALLRANVKEAAGSLFAARQRSLLALIGIAVGVGSVIAMMSVGVIVREAALQQFRELGTDALSIRIGRAGHRKRRAGHRARRVRRLGASRHRRRGAVPAVAGGDCARGPGPRSR